MVDRGMFPVNMPETMTIPTAKGEYYEVLAETEVGCMTGTEDTIRSGIGMDLTTVTSTLRQLRPSSYHFPFLPPRRTHNSRDEL